jgi:hypothetical protein
MLIPSAVALISLAGVSAEHSDFVPLGQQRRGDVFPQGPVPPVTNIGAVMDSSSRRVLTIQRL